MASQKRRGSERISSQGEARERGRCLKIRLWDRNAARRFSLSLSLSRIRSQLRLARSVADDHKSLPSASRVKLPLQSYRSCRSFVPRRRRVLRVSRVSFAQDSKIESGEGEGSCSRAREMMRPSVDARSRIRCHLGDIRAICRASRASKSIISSDTPA